jgi:hypothetical protein
VSRRDIDRDAIGVSAPGDDDLAAGAVRIQRNDTVVAEVEKEQATDCGFVARRTLRMLRSNNSIVERAADAVDVARDSDRQRGLSALTKSQRRSHARTVIVGSRIDV